MALQLGIEIGGTKLQVGVGGGGNVVAVERRNVDIAKGSAGILEQIREASTMLLAQHAVDRIGIGFGGPVLGSKGIVQTSHQVPGWNQFPLGQWCAENLGKPAVLGNDCDVAALAEARYGAGRGAASVFYVTIGTGIGGGLVLDGKIYGTERPAAAEIGHLRPGLDATNPHCTVESLAAGPAISAKMVKRLREMVSGTDAVAASQLRGLCGGDLTQLTTKQLGEAAANGNSMARDVLRGAAQALGWGLAQMSTLLAPEVIVMGGGVSLIQPEFFLNPVRESLLEYVFPPLKKSVNLVRAELGELVVVHGALALAEHA